MRWLCEASKKNRESFATIGFCSLTASWFMPEKVVHLQRGWELVYDIIFDA